MVGRKVAAAKTKAHSTPLGVKSERVAEEMVIDQAGPSEVHGQHGQPPRGAKVAGVDDLGVVGPSQRLGRKLALQQLPERGLVALSAQVGLVGQAQRSRED